MIVISNIIFVAVFDIFRCFSIKCSLAFSGVFCRDFCMFFNQMWRRGMFSPAILVIFGIILNPLVKLSRAKFFLSHCQKQKSLQINKVKNSVSILERVNRIKFLSLECSKKRVCESQTWIRLSLYQDLHFSVQISLSKKKKPADKQSLRCSPAFLREYIEFLSLGCVKSRVCENQIWIRLFLYQYLYYDFSVQIPMQKTNLQIYKF